MTKLLLDENLSWRLVEKLQPAFPETRHVDDLGLRGASDTELWDVARRDGFMLVSKDDDFRQLGLLRGAPPKILVLANGKPGSAIVPDLLTGHTGLTRHSTPTRARACWFCGRPDRSRWVRGSAQGSDIPRLGIDSCWGRESLRIPGCRGDGPATTPGMRS